MDWDKLRIFQATAEAGSFTRAGEVLQMNQSSVSRQVGALEEELKVTLFHRHARGLKLTEQGELLMRTASEIREKLQAVETVINDTKDKPFGPLKITVPIGLGSIWLVPRLREFTRLYPDIDLELQLVDEEQELSSGETEVAIRLREPQQSGLIRKKLFTVHFHIYASATYLKRAGTPRSIKDLNKHDIMLLGQTAPKHFKSANWLEQVGREGAAGDVQPRRPILKTNSVYAQKQAVKAGMGLAALPDYMVREESDLIPVLGDVWPSSMISMHLQPISSAPEHRAVSRI